MAIDWRDLANILDKIVPLGTLEMAFQSSTISKFSGREKSQTPQAVHQGFFG